MLIRENPMETAPVVGNVRAFPVRKSVICMVPVSFHGLGTLPVVTNQSLNLRNKTLMKSFDKARLIYRTRATITSS